MDHLVSLQDIGVSRGGQPVLRDINLTVGPSQTIGVVGPNGSGKTTLLRMLATLLPPDQGTGDVLGQRLGTPAIYTVRPSIGLIGHTAALIPELSIQENLEHAVRLGGLDPDRIGRALHTVGLDRVADRRIEASSHGMQRRTEIALVILRRPRLLLLDEPASGLDNHAVALIQAIVDSTTSRQGAVVMVSHDRSQLVGCDQILNLDTGEIEGPS